MDNTDYCILCGNFRFKEGKPLWFTDLILSHKDKDNGVGVRVTVCHRCRKKSIDAMYRAIIKQTLKCQGSD